MDISESQKKKVLHLITELVIGGAQDNTLLTVEGLSRERYVVHTAGAPGGTWVNRAQSVSDEVYFINHMRRNISPRHDLLAIWEIYRLLRQERYDIIHTHSSKAGLLGRIAGRLAQVPLVIHTVHGFPFNDITFSPAMRRIYIGLEWLGAQLCDHLVMVAELNRQEAIKKGIAPAHKMTVVYSGLDLRRFAELPAKVAVRRQLNLPETATVVGTVGRISACNAPLVLAEAARQLLAAHADLHVVVIGDGEMRPELEAALADQARVHLLGFRSDVPQLLPALDVFQFPNLWGGLGRSVTEALAAGLPVVAFPVNGVPELVEDRITGLHATIGDSRDLAQKTELLLQNPTWGQHLAENGQARVYQKFSAAKMVADIDALYQRLI